MIRITRTIAIGENELREMFIRASGPGGQNVNKVASAVQLHFNVAQSPSLPADVRRRLRRLAGRRVNSEGILIIEARRHRTQAQNRKDALDRLIALIKQAAQPAKKRIKTRPTRASVERRLESKRQRSQTKRLRGPAPKEE